VVELGRSLMVLKVQSQWPLDICPGADGDARDFRSMRKLCHAQAMVGSGKKHPRSCANSTFFVYRATTNKRISYPPHV
jgi:hypothetical protein